MSAAAERPLPYRLLGVLAALMGAQSALGLALQGQYRDVAWIRATWFGNDLVTLVVAVPLLLAAMALARRGSLGGHLLALGMLGYAAYNYAYYAPGAAFNAFFPLYVAALVLSVVTLVVALVRVDPAEVTRAFSPRTPVRAIGGYLVFVAVGLGAVWLLQWALYAFAGRATPIEPEAFKLVATLDLSVMIPALGFGGALLRRRSAWGTVAAAVAGVQATLYLLVLSVNSVVAIQRGLAEAPGELPLWGTLGVLTAVATLALFANAGTRAGRLASASGASQA